MKDAYQLLNDAKDIWQQNAMSNNNAADLTKRTSGIPINMKTPYGYYEAHVVYFDPVYGIVFEWAPEVQIFQD